MEIAECGIFLILDLKFGNPHSEFRIFVQSIFLCLRTHYSELYRSLAHTLPDVV